MRFANDFHSWLRHSWKLLANRLTRDPKIVIHGNSCIILYIIIISSISSNIIIIITVIDIIIIIIIIINFIIIILSSVNEYVNGVQC